MAIDAKSIKGMRASDARQINSLLVMEPLIRLRASPEFEVTEGFGGLLGAGSTTYPVIDGYVTALSIDRQALLRAGCWDDTPKKVRKKWTRRTPPPAKLAAVRPARRLTLVVNNKEPLAKKQKPIHREHLPREHLPPDDPLDAA